MRRGTAHIDGRYRYSLSRCWGPLLPQNLLWIMLNPSTADAETDDPTIRRCIDFARQWGYGGLVVVNVYALRATNPDELKAADDPIGPEWLETFISAVHGAGEIVCAWGGRASGAQLEEVREILRNAAQLDRTPVYHLGLTKSGQPRHPLYIRANHGREEYTP